MEFMPGMFGHFEAWIDRRDPCLSSRRRLPPEAVEVKYEFATPEPPKLRVRVSSGRVEIETVETGETVVEIEAIRGDVEGVRVEQRGREIVVERAQAPRLLARRRVSRCASARRLERTPS